MGATALPLAEFDCLDPTPPENLHIIIKLFGPDTGRASGTGDAPDGSGRLPEAIARTVSAVDPFTVGFPRYNVFPDAVYAEVTADGRLTDLNRALCELEGTTEMPRDGANFIPHLTPGYITQRDGYPALVDFLEENRSLALPPVRVDRLDLVVYDISDGWHPQYGTLETFDLTG